MICLDLNFAKARQQNRAAKKQLKKQAKLNLTKLARAWGVPKDLILLTYQELFGTLDSEVKNESTPAKQHQKT